MKITQQELSVKYSENSKIYPDSLRLRLYRALSWLEQAEKKDKMILIFVLSVFGYLSTQYMRMT